MIIKKMLNLILWSVLAICSSLEAPDSPRAPVKPPKLPAAATTDYLLRKLVGSPTFPSVRKPVKLPPPPKGPPPARPMISPPPGKPPRRFSSLVPRTPQADTLAVVVHRASDAATQTESARTSGRRHAAATAIQRIARGKQARNKLQRQLGDIRNIIIPIARDWQVKIEQARKLQEKLGSDYEVVIQEYVPATPPRTKTSSSSSGASRSVEKKRPQKKQSTLPPERDEIAKAIRKARRIPERVEIAQAIKEARSPKYEEARRNAKRPSRQKS